MEFVQIPAGEFEMGQAGPGTDYQMVKHPAEFDRADWDEQPRHRVRITQPFRLSVTEVTVGQYRKFAPAAAPAHQDDDAMTEVSWEEATAFCQWLSEKEGQAYRLPSEAEWEYACRAGSTSLFSQGETLPVGSQQWRKGGLRERYFPDGVLPPEYRAVAKATVTVKTQAPNAWGLFDMHGNVAEWCADWYGPYSAEPQTDPTGAAAGDFRVFRGGHHSTLTRLLRSANRAGWLPQARSPMIGFRVALGAKPQTCSTTAQVRPLYAENVSQEMATKPASTTREEPFFAGPVPYIHIPAESYGPMFSRHNHSPSITECPNGDLLAVWYSCADEIGSELNNLASRRRRESEVWEPASVFWDGPDVNDHAPKVWWDGAQTLFHFARGWSENIVRTSTDNGASWSAAQIIQPMGELGNRLLCLRDGTLVLGHDSRQVSLVYSRDAGKTWQFNDVAKRDSDFRPGGRGFRYPGIHAPMVELTDGRILAMSRQDQAADQERFGFCTPASYSAGLGKTWSYEQTEFPAISSVQRAAMIRLREGPILFCSFTDQWRDWKSRKGMRFQTKDGEFTGYGMFAALSMDEGKTWPVRRLLTPGGTTRQVNAIDRVMFTMNETMAEPCGYLDCLQARDGRIHLVTSKNHYVFNLAWLHAESAGE